MSTIVLMLRILGMLLLLAGSALAVERAQGECMQGAKLVVSNGVNSASRFMRSYVNVTGGVPTSGCTVTVYRAGTSTIATLTSNTQVNTANPFTADATGHWYFEAANGTYDVTLSGAGIPTPFTIGSVFLNDPSPVIDVRTCGALANGTTDNTTAIQTCLNSLTSGGTLLFPPGSACYKTTTITPLSNTTMAGTGCIDIIDDGTLTGRSIYINGVSNVTVRDLTIKSTNAASRTGVYGNIRTWNSSQLQFLNLKINGSSSMGMWIAYSTDILVDGNEITNTWADGIGFSRGVQRARVSNNNIYFIGDDGISATGYMLDTDVGITYAHCRDITITGNTIYNLTKLVGRGIAINGAEYITITGNTTDTIYDTGIIVASIAGAINGFSTYYSHHVTISGNTTRNTGVGADPDQARAGIYFSLARSGTITGNTVYGTNQDGISVAAIGKDVRIVGNDVSNIGARGIISTQNSAFVSDARLITELFTDLAQPGVSAPVGISDVTIADNIVRTTTSFGISVEGETALHSFGHIVSNNDLYLTGSGGIEILKSDGIIVSNNRVRSAPGDGISLGTLTAGTVTGNVVTSSTQVGITCVTCDHVAISGNVATGNGAGGIYSDPTSSFDLVAGNITTGNTSFQITVDNSSSNTSMAFNNIGVDDFGGGPITEAGRLLQFPNGVYTGPVAAATLTTRIAHYVTTFTPTSVAANTCAAQSFTLTGLVAGEFVINVTKGNPQAGLGIGGADVPSNNTLRLNFCNNTASPITPTASETYGVAVLR